MFWWVVVVAVVVAVVVVAVVVVAVVAVAVVVCIDESIFVWSATSLLLLSCVACLFFLVCWLAVC